MVGRREWERAVVSSLSRAPVGVLILFLAFACDREDPPHILLAKTVSRQALSTTLVSATKGVSDDTGDTLAALDADDASSEDPDTDSAVSTGDNVYTVDRNATMHIDTFNVSSIPVGATITAAVLHLQYGAEDGYAGSTAIEFNKGGGFVSTGIVPSDILGWSADLTQDLFAQGVDTRMDLEALDVRFVSGDSDPDADAIHFDYI